VTDLARKLTAHARFTLVSGMCFETEQGCDWIAGIDTDDNPHIFGLHVDGEALKIGTVADAYPPPDVCGNDDCDTSPTFGHNVWSGVRFCRSCVQAAPVACIESPKPPRKGLSLPETAWLKLDDPATFGALWSLLPRGRWTLEMYAGRCAVFNSDEIHRDAKIANSPGEAVGAALLAFWERA